MTEFHIRKDEWYYSYLTGNLTRYNSGNYPMYSTEPIYPVTSPELQAAMDRVLVLEKNVARLELAVGATVKE